MKNPWKTVSSKVVHQNPWWKVRHDKVIRPDGSDGEYFVVDYPSAVFIVALSEKQEVYLIDTFRYTTGMHSIEIPAGNSDNQKPLVAARRELLEETGLTAKKWKQIGKFQTANGIMNTISYVFLAQELHQTANNEQVNEGITKASAVPFHTVTNMIKRGKITDDGTVIAMSYAAIELEI